MAKREVKEFTRAITGADNVWPYEVRGLGMSGKHSNLKAGPSMDSMDLQMIA